MAAIVRSHVGEVAASGVADKRDDISKDVLSALVNLGYKGNLAEKAIEKAKQINTDATFEILLKESLKVLAHG